MPLKPENIRTAADARKIVEERGLTHVKVGVFDVDGVLRGKYISKVKFFSALESGFGFCDVVLGWDSNDQLYDNVTFTGWHTAYPDAFVRVLPETCRAIAVRGEHPALPLRVRGPGRGHLPARHAAARAAAGREAGLRRQCGLRVRILHLRRDARERAREGLSQPHQHHPRLLRLFGPAQLRLGRSLSRDPRQLRGHAHPHRGAAHRDRARRAGGGPLLRPRAGGGRQGGAVQDLHEGAGPAPRADGDLHGQMVEQLSGPERPYPHVPQGQGRQGAVP